MNFIVVGAGLFGSMTARALMDDGHTVMVIDDRDTSCSKASGCIIKPSWLMGIPEGKRKRGLAHLLYHYQDSFREIDFTLHPTGKVVTAWHLPPQAVLLSDDAVTKGVVTPDNVAGWLAMKDPIVIICAGVGTSKILPAVHVKGVMGVSLVFPDQVCEPQIRIWAPYKQAVCVNNPNGAWFGNSTGVQPERWNDSYVDRAVAQARDFFGLEGNHYAQMGVRPYVEGQNGLLDQVELRLWVNTGGAKSGAVLAAAHAEEIRTAYAPEIFR